MRLDLFLKHSRLVVRRPVAQAMCDAGAVTVNGATGKPGRSVASGDTLTIRQRGRITTVRILAVPERPPSKAQAGELYEILDVVDDPDADGIGTARSEEPAATVDLGAPARFRPSRSPGS